ncbi:MAG: alpha-glucosidase [Eubacteriales bacterium]
MSNWWQDRVVYQIYPRSFQDTNGDGIGDIPGIISRLPELSELGVGILWLSPVYCSPDDDNGYDISDYRSIQPAFGTMADMDDLIAQAGKLDIKVVMDLVINHTSDEHEWFQKSRDPKSPYRNYYIWRPAVNGGLPNNWTSFFAEDCWEYDKSSGEYYLHLFSKKQPDLNYHNPAVLVEVENIMRFWLDKGVSGFRCDVINILYKASLDDGTKKMILTGSEHYISRNGTHEVLRRLRRDVLDHYDCFTVGETVFVTPAMARDLCDRSRGELDMVFSFEHMETDQYIVKWFKRRFRAGRFAKVITKWQGALEWNANYFENHDQPRSVSRFGNDTEYWKESAKMLAVCLLSLRGTPYIFQGQEIGMTNFDFKSMDEIRDIESHNVYRLLRHMHFPRSLCWNIIRVTSRDNARTPMQWSNSVNAGFTAGTPWLGINQNYRRINVYDQRKDSSSIRKFYQKMIAVRGQSDTLKYGTFHALHTTNRLFAFEREYGGEKLTVLLSFSPKKQKAACPGSVLITSSGRTAYDGILAPYEAVVLKSEVKA